MKHKEAVQKPAPSERERRAHLKRIRGDSAIKTTLASIFSVMLLMCLFARPMSLVYAAPEEGDGMVARVVETGALFTTLEAAVAAVDVLGHGTIEVIDNVVATESIPITSNVTIVGANGAHSITFASGKNFSFAGGTLTLGDGTGLNTLTMNAIGLTNGTLNLREGVRIPSAYIAIKLTGPLAKCSISGGYFFGTDSALDMSDGAQLSEISGGVFTSPRSAVHLSSEGTRIGVISGGEFYKTDTSIERGTFYVQNYSSIGLISGGYFESCRNLTLIIIRSGWVDEISGGEFVATNNPAFANQGTIAVVSDHDFNGKTGIGLISGGLIRGSYYGILVLKVSPFTDPRPAVIERITGGTIQGVIALQVDVECDVGSITGGTITGSSYGILNVSRIGEIGGTARITGNGIYGVWNYDSRASIGRISGGTIQITGSSGYAVNNNGSIGEISGGLISAAGASGMGVFNKGSVGVISGGTLIGTTYAINNISGSTIGSLGTITGGVFWAKNNVAINLGSSVILEPGLSALKGQARFWGNNGVIFNDEGLVVYPSGYYMSTATEPVAGLDAAGFKYLTRDASQYTVTYNANGGANAPTDSQSPYAEESMVTVLGPGSMSYAGNIFVGWNTRADGSGTGYAPGVTFKITANVTLYAQWQTYTEPLPTYTVKYLPGTRGTFAAVSFANLSYGEATPAAPATTGQNGWRFTGWSPARAETVTRNVEYTAQWERITVPIVTPDPGPGPEPVVPGPDPGPGPVVPGPVVPGPEPEVTPTPVPVEPDAPTPEQVTTNPEPEPAPVPIPATESPAWALLNLILAACGVVITIAAIIRVLVPRRSGSGGSSGQDRGAGSRGAETREAGSREKDERKGIEAREEQFNLGRLIWLIAVIIFGIVGAVVFFLTENIHNPMVFIDNWTIVNVLLLLFGSISFLFVVKRKEDSGADKGNAQQINVYLADSM